ncbi:hypothetical protein [Rhodobacteraceae phage LS06-2018-MD07]|nr:hypothetical protein [Rhodobacteraceae phage LS06-2018-MD07]
MGVEPIRRTMSSRDRHSGDLRLLILLARIEIIIPPLIARFRKHGNRQLTNYS